MARQKKELEDNNALSLKTMTKSSVWDIQENDVYRMLESGLKDPDVRESFRHYVDIIRCAFEIQEFKELSPVQKTKPSGVPRGPSHLQFP